MEIFFCRVAAIGPWEILIICLKEYTNDDKEEIDQPWSMLCLNLHVLNSFTNMEGVKIMLRSPFKESALHQFYANTTLHTMQILLYNIGQKLRAVHIINLLATKLIWILQFVINL